VFVTVTNCSFFLSKLLTLNQFVILSVIFLLFFSAVYYRNYGKIVIGNIGLGLIVIGGILNLIQWLKYGCVKDFINFFGLFSFNFFDLMITMGIALVGITIWKKK